MIEKLKGKITKRAAALGIAAILLLAAFIPIFSPAWGEGITSADKFNMSYIYFGDSKEYLSQINRTKGSLDTISPNYFNLESNGSLLLTSALDTSFVQEMHNRNIRVVPFLSNHWDRELGKKALQNREVLVREIVTAVNTYNLDGINVDIENLTENERSSYTDLVRLLRENLPPGKEVSVAVAVNPYYATYGWAASYDYTALAQYSDYLMLMAYDEHHQGGSPGPVASSDFVEESIKYALTKVPKEKIVLGLPFFGRVWKDNSSINGIGISNQLVEELIKKYNGSVVYDQASSSPKAVITIRQWDEKPTVSGRKLEAGTYTIWYENDTSIKNKLRLVQKYDLKGTGSWSLGQEPAGIWDYYSLWLNGHYYEDIEGHWGEPHILSIYEKGWVAGVSSTQFAPDAPLTRAQAAVIIVNALELEGTGETIPFDDVKGHWGSNAIEIARQHNIISGVGNNLFEPDRPVTREQMAIILDHALNWPADTNTNTVQYRDVSPTATSWSYNPIMKMSQYGIFSGYPDGTFQPTRTITRAQMAVIMNKSAEYIK